MIQQLQTEIIELTPALAAELLKNNTANRPCNPAHVDRLVGLMLRGEWQLNGDTIRISKSGRLLDGQHRCAAVVKSGMTVPTLLVRGLPDEVFSSIDRGKTRSTSDSMSILGEKNSKQLAAICRHLFIYLLDGNPIRLKHASRNPSPDQLLSLLQQNPDLRKSASWVRSAVFCRNGKFPPALYGFCHYIFGAKDPDAAETFFQGLETGAGLGARSPVLLLRNRLIENTSSRETIDIDYKAALMFKAFKLHRDGASVGNLRVRLEGDGKEKDVFVL